MGIILIALVFWILVFGTAGFAIGHAKGRGAAGLLLGLFLGLIGVILTALIPATIESEVKRRAMVERAVRRSGDSQPEPDQGARRTCPWCAETIKAAALVCRYCGRDVEPLQTAITTEVSEGVATAPFRCPSCSHTMPVLVTDELVTCTSCWKTFDFRRCLWCEFAQPVLRNEKAKCASCSRTPRDREWSPPIQFSAVLANF